MAILSIQSWRYEKEKTKKNYDHLYRLYIVLVVGGNSCKAAGY